MRARGDDEVVTRHFYEAVRVSDLRDVNGHRLRGLGLLEARDLLTEAELDFHLSALLI
jgi:hypothetical protein